MPCWNGDYPAISRQFNRLILSKIHKLLRSAVRKAQERAELKDKLAALAERSGFGIYELFGKTRKKGGQGSVPPKYRNPSDASETWTGRGRMPLWLKAVTDKGAKREKFLIK